MCCDDALRCCDMMCCDVPCRAVPCRAVPCRATLQAKGGDEEEELNFDTDSDEDSHDSMELNMNFRDSVDEQRMEAVRISVSACVRARARCHLVCPSSSRVDVLRCRFSLADNDGCGLVGWWVWSSSSWLQVKAKQQADFIRRNEEEERR